MEPRIDARLQKYITDIQLAAMRGSGLTRQLLVLSRKETVQFQTLDLNDVIREMESMMR